MSISGLHIRRRLRRRLVGLLDRAIARLDPGQGRGAGHASAAAPPPPTTPPGHAAPPQPAATKAATESAPPVAPEATPPQAPEAPKESTPGSPRRLLPPLTGAPEPRAARADPAAEAKPSPADRQARHWERTRKGLLRFVAERGGSASLAELHEHSESTYFVAHVSFSRMMEELTGGGQLDYDHDTATATITEAGRGEL